MATIQDQTANDFVKDEAARPEVRANAKIDRTAPAGSESSLGAESVRDGRPESDDKVVEAIDEANPGAAE
jgi:hypothetical protein